MRQIVILLCLAGVETFAQRSTVLVPSVEFTASDGTRIALLESPELTFPAGADSNSPAFWDLSDGRRVLRVMNSAGHPSIAEGARVGRWMPAQRVRFTNEIDGGRWMEAVIQDLDGTLYGYYHNEPASVCEDASKTAPRIGAARSDDGGFTWDDLGIVLEAPPAPPRCETPNHYFYGGVGDFSVVLNAQRTDAYFFFSAYSGEIGEQGVAAARLPWHHRDDPRGQVAVWDGYLWRHAEPDGSNNLVFPAAGPVYPVMGSWHDASRQVNALWGPSIHWNTHLEKWVMLLNRAVSPEWTQEGVYIAFADTLEMPSAWSKPMRIVSGGGWYPQVIGLEPLQGTDKQADRIARLFIAGVSRHTLAFIRNRP